ncbi:YciI family protein [Microbacterium sp. CJ88]|uniref:YciI family protein n=1 Tax=Microbacterium sp. CJ88 TaxID=3445672 RepID=UPI003F65AB03
MKYVIMFTSTPELDAAVPPEQGQDVYGRVYTWFGEHDEKITDSGAELQPASTATTVRHDDAGGTVVVDGPFSEAKEVIGGFSVIDVPDLDAAIAMVKTWPMLELPGTSVEIRPMVVDYTQFEQ